MKLWLSTVSVVLLLIWPVSLEQTVSTTQPSNQPNPLPIASTDASTPPDDCNLHRGRTISNRTESNLCCNLVFERFAETWHDESDYLTEFLETLRIWDCAQFASECANRTFGFNSFTDLVYERACDRNVFLGRCLESTKEVLKRRGIENASAYSPTLLRSVHFTESELSEPCVQVGLYDAITQERGSGFGYFHEMKRVFLPFCGIVWCGVDARSVHERTISARTCMTHRCQTNVTVVMAFCGILAIVNVIMNLTVLVVMFRSKKLRCSQGVYRISLAFADLIAGAIIYPTFANNLAKITASRESMGPAYNQRQNIQNGTFDSVPHLPGGNVWAHLDGPYLKFVGFFTSMYLTVTIYTLFTACVDRFEYVRISLRSSKEHQKRAALISVTCVWSVAIVISIIPFFVDEYTLIASVMVLASGPSAIYIYLFAFFLPILVMWAVSMATCCCSRMRREQIVKDGTEGSVHSQLKEELRKTYTLNVMVGVFTINLIIGCIAAAGSYFTDGIEFSDPFSLVVENAAMLASLELVAIMFLVFNSLCNFPIYYIRDADFRAECWKVFRICVPCRGSERKGGISGTQLRFSSSTMIQEFPDSLDMSSSSSKDLPGSIDVIKPCTFPL
ncbi:uncharacterized protein LOC143462958 [Clavelina lepadiformis]|uniref:uncharacterized protein LOC143462958 n=1 Tax=Clavelina lepadiformis TaxID=159417 RepID=UPI004042CD72